MSDQTISCPKCGAEIPFSEALSHKLREQFQAQLAQERASLNAAIATREAKLAAEKALVEQRAHAVADEVAARLATACKGLVAEATAEAETKLASQLQELQTRVSDQQSRIQAAQDSELALLKEKRQLEEARAAMELEVARKMDAERQQIADQARQQGVEAERLKVADKDNVIKGLQQQISALQQRAEQGSMQLQGETLEFTLEAELRDAFRFDDINEVRKGERGADISQRVRMGGGQDAGLILWEAKRAKNWSAQWTEKLREDQRAATADLAVIVTTCPPVGLHGIGLHDGVWVCQPAFAIGLAAALRQGLISTAAHRTQQANRADRMAALYDHLCSVEFRQHIEAVVEAFVGLRDQLDSEQRAFARQWKEREQQIQKAITHTAMLYGGVQGIAGREALPEIRTLALPE